MTSPYSLIPDIKPGPKQQKWTAKVIVAGKMPARKSKSNGAIFQNLILMDLKGNTIQGTLWEESVSAFEKDLIPAKTYLISNAHVKKTSDRYVSYAGPIQWNILRTTRVELTKEDNRSFLLSKFTFTSFHQLANYMDKNKSIGVIGSAVHIYPKRLTHTQNGPVYVQDIVLMNKEFETVMLTVWDTYVDAEGVALAQQIGHQPIVIGQNLRVTSFNGITVNTHHNSYFYINGDFQEVEEFKSWVAANASKINDVLEVKRTAAITPCKVSMPVDEPYICIKEIQSLGPKIEAKKNFWVRATARVLVQKTPFWFLACSICHRGSSADNLGDIFLCRYCNSVSAITIARARAEVELKDSTGSIQASMIGEVAEKFFQCSAESIMMNNTSEDEAISHQMRMQTDEDHTFYLKATPSPTIPVDSAKGISAYHPASDFKLEILFIVELEPSQTSEPTPTYMNDESPVEKSTNPPTSVRSPSAKRALFQDPAEVNSSSKKIEKISEQDHVNTGKEKLL